MKRNFPPPSGTYIAALDEFGQAVEKLVQAVTDEIRSIMDDYFKPLEKLVHLSRSFYAENK